jgi:23S rRNA pseudouridine1911/1915/1917 synthase
MRCGSASAVPRGHVSPAGTGTDNGSARIQTRRLKTPTTPTWTVTREEQGLRLDRFLAAAGRLGSRGRVRVALERGQVFVNEVEASTTDAGSRVAPGDIIRLWIDRPGSARPRTFGASARQALHRGGLHVLFEDEMLLVVNKPAGLLAVPLERRGGAPSLYERIEDHLRSRGKRRPLIVHRIDRDTSGLVVFAKTARAQQALKSQFKRREPERIYLALVYGHLQPPHGTWRDQIVWDRKALIQKKAQATDPKASVAISDYRVLETLTDTSLIEVRLQTGKQNQIRIQAGLHGHPLVGEKRYVADAEQMRVAFPRQALHAYRLAFRHPADDRLLTFEAPLPGDLSALLGRLRTEPRKSRRTTSHTGHEEH